MNLFQLLDIGEAKKQAAQDFVDLFSIKNSPLNLWLTSWVNFLATMDKSVTIAKYTRNW